jgi:hypothetical protein
MLVPLIAALAFTATVLRRRLAVAISPDPEAKEGSALAGRQIIPGRRRPLSGGRIQPGRSVLMTWR